MQRGQRVQVRVQQLRLLLLVVLQLLVELLQLAAAAGSVDGQGERGDGQGRLGRERRRRYLRRWSLAAGLRAIQLRRAQPVYRAVHGLVQQLGHVELLCGGPKLELQLLESLFLHHSQELAMMRAMQCAAGLRGQRRALCRAEHRAALQKGLVGLSKVMTAPIECNRPLASRAPA